MITQATITVQSGSDMSHSTIVQAENEPFDTFLGRIKTTLHIHQRNMIQIQEQKK